MKFALDKCSIRFNYNFQSEQKALIDDPIEIDIFFGNLQKNFLRLL